MQLFNHSSIEVLDCDDQGLILKEGGTLLWDEIAKLVKCEYPGRELACALYYVQKKNSHKNFRISSFGGFPFPIDREKEKKALELKLKIIGRAKKKPALKLVTKATPFGKEKLWDMEKEEALTRYWISPGAERAYREYKQQAVLVTIGFFVVVVLLLLTVWVFSLVINAKP